MPSLLAGLEDPSTPSEGTTVEQPLMSSGGAEGEEVERGEKMDPDNLSSPSVENNEADQRSQPQPQSKLSPMPELKPLPRTRYQSPQISQCQSLQMTQTLSLKAIHSPTIRVFLKEDAQPIILQDSLPWLDGRILEPEYDVFVRLTRRDNRPNPM
uniref:Uncharacterized protein n=1 Tax=Penaeus monodon majanivirus A TaxID=2984271 RepID=A0A9C7C518_9VIRU|nr:MAG: hypothetical protein [Penaeus monodon majanivirus A]